MARVSLAPGRRATGRSGVCDRLPSVGVGEETSLEREKQGDGKLGLIAQRVGEAELGQRERPRLRRKRGEMTDRVLGAG